MKETAYLLQAALIGLWWIGLAMSPGFFEAFQFDGISSIAFWSFVAPDIFFIAGLSVARAYNNRPELEWLVLGAFGYATLYCVNASLLTQSGFLPSGLMLLGLAYNILLCFGTRVFRNSTSSPLQNALKTLVQIICIWLLALVVIPYVLVDAFGSAHWPESPLTMFLGLALFIAFGALGLVSSFFLVRDGDGTPIPLDQTNRLVVTGPYRYVRNPMAIAGIGQGIAVAVACQSLAVLAYAILGIVVWHVVVRPLEERDLAERFGDDYLKYQQAIWCWLPRLTPYVA